MTDPRQPYGEPDLKIEGLSIWALEREFPLYIDFWDGNWIIIHARAEAPGSVVNIYGAYLRSEEVQAFLTQLEILDRDLSGQAELACMEPMLQVKVIAQPRGQLKITVQITPDIGTQKHEIDFASDQTIIKHAIAGCRAILTEFPVIGSPDAP